MSKQSKYISKEYNQQGLIEWLPAENQIWSELYAQQIAVIEGRACDEYIQGLSQLKLPTHRVPQLTEVNRVLQQSTGWQVKQVPALINFDEFFHMLANKQFPVATFIRSRSEFDYLQEPDIFHEIFGHCPLLTNPAFAHFTHRYGQLGHQATKEQRAYLARLYWFTVEFGLLNTSQGLRIYGGGILSSPGETHYALESDTVIRQPLDIIEVMRTPYRIDIMQPIYFTINQLQQLDEISQQDIMTLVTQAQKLGMHSPKFVQKHTAKISCP
ncbi:phenylalanine 4-monooxygenase [Alteromonadaceae bacterium BrNp21-10]|nr:phenylalanine 4-monooxygenase [Alteromonadaceae bacterium BrNp21-10]